MSWVIDLKKESELIQAVAKGDLENLKKHLVPNKELLDKPAISLPVSPLAIALYYGQYECFKFLCQQGADVNFQFKGDSLLHIAIQRALKGNEQQRMANLRCMLELLQKDISILTTNNEGQTALMLAKKLGRPLSFLLLFCHEHALERIQDATRSEDPYRFSLVFQEMKRQVNLSKDIMYLYTVLGSILADRPNYAYEAYCLLTEALSFTDVHPPTNEFVSCHKLLAEFFLSGRLLYRNNRVIAVNESQWINTTLESAQLLQNSLSSQSQSMTHNRDAKEQMEVTLSSEAEENILRGLYHLSFAGDSQEVSQERIRFTNRLLRVPNGELRFGDFQEIQSLIMILRSCNNLEEGIKAIKQKIQDLRLKVQAKHQEVEQEKKKVAELELEVARLQAENELMESISNKFTLCPKQQPQIPVPTMVQEQTAIQPQSSGIPALVLPQFNNTSQRPVSPKEREQSKGEKRKFEATQNGFCASSFDDPEQAANKRPKLTNAPGA